MSSQLSEVSTAPRRLRHLIDGAWVEPGETIDRHAPGTGELVSVVGAAGATEVEAAVAAARAAFDARQWPDAPAPERAAVLTRAADAIETHAEHLARLDAEEAGKPLRLARADIAGAVELTRYAAGQARQMHGLSYTNYGPDFTGLVLREPIGVAGLIIPWNFPALILCQKLPFALAAGCTVVVKPSELTSSSAVQIARLYREVGLPDGVLNVVTGDGRAGQALAESRGVDVLSFTGSTVTGGKVLDAAKTNMKKVSLELGGKAASIVFADADLAAASAGVTFGAFFNNGECCVSQARLLVQDSIADRFLQLVTERTRGLRLGQPLKPETDVGAAIHAQHLDRVLGDVEAARAAGARLVTGGTRASGPELAGGLFAEPTILADVTPSMDAFTTEIFGPVLTVTTFHDTHEAVTLANAVDYGLANTIWSRDIDTVLAVARALRSGTVYVNTTIDAPPVMPFGGYKASGFGREMGQAGFEEFTELKSVNIRSGSRADVFPFGALPPEPGEIADVPAGVA